MKAYRHNRLGHQTNKLYSCFAGVLFKRSNFVLENENTSQEATKGTDSQSAHSLESSRLAPRSTSISDNASVATFVSNTTHSSSLDYSTEQDFEDSSNLNLEDLYLSQLDLALIGVSNVRSASTVIDAYPSGSAAAAAAAAAAKRHQVDVQGASSLSAASPAVTSQPQPIVPAHLHQLQRWTESRLPNPPPLPQPPPDQTHQYLHQRGFRSHPQSGLFFKHNPSGTTYPGVGNFSNFEDMPSAFTNQGTDPCAHGANHHSMRYRPYPSTTQCKEIQKQKRQQSVPSASGGTSTDSRARTAKDNTKVRPSKKRDPSKPPGKRGRKKGQRKLLNLLFGYFWQRQSRSVEATKRVSVWALFQCERGSVRIVKSPSHRPKFPVGRNVRSANVRARTRKTHRCRCDMHGRTKI